MVEYSTFDKDIYLEAQDRLKKDIIFYKKHCLTHDTALSRDRVKLTSLRGNAFNKSRISSRCKTILESMEKTVTHKDFQRRTKMNSFYDVLHRKE